VLLLALAIAIRSALLSALSVLVIAGLLGSSTGYDFATYSVEIREPTVTITVFSLLALAAYLVSFRIPGEYETVAISFSRLCLVMVNFGFWIGSLWGDDPGHSCRFHDRLHPVVIPDYVFVIAWAAALIGVGVWAARADRRFIVNMVATFGAIHFYTQWFERLGAEPLTILLAGVLIVAIAVGLWRYNARTRTAAAAAA
jgi:iron complex transport system permease protein